MNVAPLSPFPDERQVLLLRAALLGGEEAIDAWERWRRTGDGIGGHDPASFRLLPLLYRNLSAHGVDDPEMSKLSGVYRHAWYCNQRLFHEASGVIRDLERAGVETLALKGAALTALYYCDNGTRPMDDLDLLVRFDNAERATRVLRDAGWTLQSRWPLDDLLIARHAIGFTDRTGRELDLHWRALCEPGSDDRFWADSVAITVRGAPTRALSPEHQLIHICVHGIGLMPAPMRWVADAITVIEVSREKLNWEAIAAEARERRVTLALSVALRYLAQTFGTPVPRDALAALARSNVRVGERLAHRAAMGRPRRGRFYVFEWDRYRRLRHVEPSLAPPTFLAYLQCVWGLTSQRQVAARLVARVLLAHPLPKTVGARDPV